MQTNSFLHFKFVLLCPIIKNNMLIVDLEITNHSVIIIYFIGKQSFYLIDEVTNPGKGANSVTNMVHHYFNRYIY